MSIEKILNKNDSPKAINKLNLYMSYGQLESYTILFYWYSSPTDYFSTPESH